MKVGWSIMWWPAGAPEFLWECSKWFGPWLGLYGKGLGAFM
jgi:hypothetical protein